MMSFKYSFLGIMNLVCSSTMLMKIDSWLWLCCISFNLEGFHVANEISVNYGFSVGYCDWYGANQSPADTYFQRCKVQQWSIMADVVTDAIRHTKEELQQYFDQTNSDVMNQLTGLSPSLW